MKHIKLYLLLITVIFSSCSEDGVEVLGTGTITGTVIEEITGDPVENAKISTSPATSTVFTDSDGEFILENVTVDDYSVQAEFDGFVTAFESVTVTLNNTSNVAFELTTSVSNNTPPSVPELIFPEDEATGLPLEIDFAWNATDSNNDDLLYTLELRNGTTDEIRIFENIEDTVQTVSGLQLGTNYFWQIMVSDEVNDPVSSPISEFSTLDSPDNPFLFVKQINGNNVIFSGNESEEDNNEDVDVNVLQLTSENANSFMPRRNIAINKIAFFRTVGGNLQLFTMDEDGSDVNQVTNTVPVAGFRQDEINFSWGRNGSILYYPNFDKLYSVSPNGGNTLLRYSTPDGSFISEIQEFENNNNLLLIKTNNESGYDVRLYVLNIVTLQEEAVLLDYDEVNGAVKGIDVNAQGTAVVYSRDESEFEDDQTYRILEGRLYFHPIMSDSESEILTGVQFGENDLGPRFSPTDGSYIFTRSGNNAGAPKTIYRTTQNGTEPTKILFTNASMPDWEE
ncbi:carboxypeptidase regulatory-like domain-containing protein [Cochleicola gelatinilyticus]|uniref:Fibronectin type-III domain-containing protein n=1 Tax=Cochleicola gelatinilyticus TaxID=1763537 RepID=A0A167ERR8_9FLAO|nr:carboxypeptidase regulatory-like domain-containing protein [Cochleicola gelatinilyticus]OAB75818.1 hypothetical protein ULVI_15190 [Cochleicola gelatinilyticus]